MSAARLHHSTSGTRSLSPARNRERSGVVTRCVTGVHAAVTMTPRESRHGFQLSPHCSLLLRRSSTAGQALALETLPGEPEVDDRAEASAIRLCRPTSRWRAGASSPSIAPPAGSRWSSGRSRSSCWKAARVFSSSRIRHRSKASVPATRCASRSSATAAATGHARREQQLGRSADLQDRVVRSRLAGPGTSALQIMTRHWSGAPPAR